MFHYTNVHSSYYMITRAVWLIGAGAYPGLYSITRLEVLLLLDGMLVHDRGNTENTPNLLSQPRPPIAAGA